jgi:uncharacterized LabA/DUF88 family protein
MASANFYIDGFNLYYGCLKGSPYRWLDLERLCQELTPTLNVRTIRYFTAHVVPSPASPSGSQDQLTYLRALETLPKVTIHLGSFLMKKTKGLELDPATRTPTGRVVEVQTPEEKGSDVNLAAYLMLDAAEQKAEVFVVVSGDSDLAEPIRLVRDHFQRPVYVVNPRVRKSFELQKVATRYYSIFPRSLKRSQLSPTLADAQGTITKPTDW